MFIAVLQSFENGSCDLWFSGVSITSEVVKGVIKVIVEKLFNLRVAFSDNPGIYDIWVHFKLAFKTLSNELNLSHIRVRPYHYQLNCAVIGRMNFSGRGVLAFQDMSEILPVDWEIFGDIEQKVTHIESKHNREMTRFVWMVCGKGKLQDRLWNEYYVNWTLRVLNVSLDFYLYIYAFVNQIDWSDDRPIRNYVH